jgi:hypothetical protein
VADMIAYLLLADPLVQVCLTTLILVEIVELRMTYWLHENSASWGR